MLLLFILLDNLSLILIINSLIPVSVSLKYRKIKTIKFPNGPHIKPQWLNVKPVRVYDNPNYYRNIIGSENKKRSVVYQWFNLINGKSYVGSSWNGSTGLLSYWTPSILRRNYPIYQSINYYGIHNFALAILEDLGSSSVVTKEYILSREQFYLDLLFTNTTNTTNTTNISCGSGKVKSATKRQKR